MEKRIAASVDGNKTQPICNLDPKQFSCLSNSIVYRKIPVISPGLIQLRKGFWWAYKRRGLYLGELISEIEKTFRNEPRQC